MSDLLVHGPGVPRLASQNAVSKAKRKLSTDHGSFQLSRLVKGATGVVSAWQDNFFKGGERARIEDRKQILAARMETATTFEDWQNAARELDHLEGNDAWKLDDQHRDCEFDPDLIRAKMEELDTARTDCDMSAMMYLIRSCLSRELGGMGDADLYRHSYMGTKVLIERYVQSAVQTIEAVVEKSSYQTEMGARELLDGMVYARQTYGRSALLLSGGATFGMSHIGVVKSLFEQGMLPRVVSGASAGSIVCAVLCTRKDEEIPDLIRAFPFGDLAVFETPGETEWDHLRRLITKHSWSDISNLTRVMRGWLGDMTFLEAYNRSRRVCNICVSSASIYDVPRLLNYVTAPDVLIWTAVAASCSVPLVFQAHPLLMKNPATGAHEPWIAAPQHYIDGSVDNDLPMPRLAEMFNVNHFIVSQVNPHIVPFLPRDDVLVPGKPRPKSPPQPPSAARQWLTKLAATTFTEGLHRLHFLAESGVFPNLMTKLYCVLSQTYSGDITIIPEIPASDLPVMLKNPTAEFMQRNCLVGERAVWPKMGRIRDRLSVELALDRAVHALRTKVVFRSSQVDMRRAMGAWQPEYFGGGGMGSGGVLSPSFGGRWRGLGGGGMSLRRRRGSGASIQLVAARHRKAFQHLLEDAEYDDPEGVEDDEEEEEEEEDRLEIGRGQGLREEWTPVVAKGTPKAAAAAVSRNTTTGRRRARSFKAGINATPTPPAATTPTTGLAMPTTAAATPKPPKLRRNAKSVGHMRAGKPVQGELRGWEMASVGGWAKLQMQQREQKQQQQKEQQQQEEAAAAKDKEGEREEEGSSSWVGVGIGGGEEGSGAVSEAWSEIAAPAVLAAAEGVRRQLRRRWQRPGRKGVQGGVDVYGRRTGVSLRREGSGLR